MFSLECRVVRGVEPGLPGSDAGNIAVAPRGLTLEFPMQLRQLYLFLRGCVVSFFKAENVYFNRDVTGGRDWQTHFRVLLRDQHVPKYVEIRTIKAKFIHNSPHSIFNANHQHFFTISAADFWQKKKRSSALDGTDRQTR